jgi:hypothetical protein
MVTRQKHVAWSQKLLRMNLYITTHDAVGNGTFVNNLDSYMFVIMQIHAFDMFTGREVGHVPNMCPHAKVHICTHNEQYILFPV